VEAVAKSGLQEKCGGALATNVGIGGGARSSANVRSARTTTEAASATTLAALEVDEPGSHGRPSTEDEGAPTLGGQKARRSCQQRYRGWRSTDASRSMNTEATPISTPRM
jgi:hypothetical protein